MIRRPQPHLRAALDALVERIERRRWSVGYIDSHQLGFLADDPGIRPTGSVVIDTDRRSADDVADQIIAAQQRRDG